MTAFETVVSLFIIPVSEPIILNKMSNRFIETLGRASYDIFLCQMVYYYSGAGVIYIFVSNRWLQLIINLIVCISAGLLFYYIETPITKIVYDKMYCIWNKLEKDTGKFIDKHF